MQMTALDRPETAKHQTVGERRVAALVFLITFIGFAWFFQGSGENQNAHFDTVRALAEQHTFDITAYADNTRDVVRRDGKLYSNKLPGLPLLGVLVYWPVQFIERAAFQIDLNATRVRQLNHYLVTLLYSALPASITVLTMRALLRRDGSSVRFATYAALALGFGTLLFPFAGVLMVHNIVAMCILVAWLLLTSPEPRQWKDAAAGALMGWAVLADHLTLPVVALLLMYIAWDRKQLRAIKAFLVGPIVAVVALVVYRAAVLGDPMDTGVADPSAEFVDERLLFGVFNWPDVRRLYWLSFHPFRGLFYCCPILLLAPLGMFYARRELLTPKRFIPLAIIAWYVIFNLSFNGWTGGVGVGPRYLIPAIPMMFLFATVAMQRHRTFAFALAAFSIFIMFAVAAVRLMHPWANNFGPPLDENPVATSIQRLLMGDVARNIESFNLGLAMGLGGPFSLIPPLIVFATLLLLLHRITAPQAPVEEARR